MIKRAPSRNARTRGFKVKHVLQICLLLGVCFWLIYQLKHSHDKKKELDEYEAQISVRTQSDVGISNLGRKGLHPRVQELSKDKKHEEEDDEETTVDEEVNKMEENKHEQKQVEGEAKYEEDEREEGTKHIEEEQEEEGTKHEEEEQEEEGTKHEEEEREEGNKHEDDEQEEEIEDERRGGGDDEIGEHDQEKLGEADHEEDLVDGERGREEQGEEKESGNDEAEDKEAQSGHETSTEDQDNDGGVQNDHEAREEHYKADDASSAVTHDSQTISAEAENTSSDNSNDNSVTNDLELERNSNSINTNDVSGDEKNSQSQLEGVVSADNDPPPNATAAEKKDDKIINVEDLSTKHATFSSLSNDQPVLSNTSKDVNVEAGNNPEGGRTETSGSSQHNGTLLTSDSNQVQNATIYGASTGEASNLKTTEWVQVNNSIVSGNIETNSISSIPDKTLDNISAAATSNFSANSEPAGSGKVIKPEVTAEAEVRPDGSDKIIKPELEVNAEAEVKPDGSDKVIKPEPEVNSEVNSESSSTTKETAHDANESGGTEENLGSSATDGTEAVVHDHTDSSVGQEEKEARIDLETLPGDSGEGVNSRDAAAE
ncbi:cilia- and flagella-associated protein 251 [Manihot esculenta]|uniref:Uncharacterized protein n=2 Tax=Manihot esculenta TaxID=3983 RepID=A0A2C9V4K4_MANES|nr:cilia- and flagella-associated protein 251 [Manihot esculenta]XP_043817112.1 cilia- and flagella-associated protein 251 [Manihot esculenta]KAG8645735.1 hypothetical protein MANES_10G087900v8 [Manihot esculenta]OAY39353.1 hypothetical protein MANES_10G087900v8 [Manihot esculenta]